MKLASLTKICGRENSDNAVVSKLTDRSKLSLIKYKFGKLNKHVKLYTTKIHLQNELFYKLC